MMHIYMTDNGSEARILAQRMRFISEWFVYITLSNGYSDRFGGFDSFKDAENWLLGLKFESFYETC